ncbi:MAG: M50 family metallopeptidase [Planctomycetota bacterium]|nr:M50 family metallopeptidase [Planctomycetota bacterium]
MSPDLYGKTPSASPPSSGYVPHKGVGGPYGCSLVLLFLAAFLLWNTVFMYPLRLLVVLMHESGHALAAILTGGRVVSITITPQEAGVAVTAGGWRLLILCSGYLGSVIFGALLLRATVVPKLREVLLEIMAAGVLAVMLFFVGWADTFTLVYCIAAAIVLFLVGVKTRPAVEYFIVRFVAVASCLFAFLDLRGDLLSFSAVFGRGSG